VQRKAALQETIDLLQHRIQTAKVERKTTPRHIAVSELPEADRFQQLSTLSKHLIDTIRGFFFSPDVS
jgi:hypothetical protein